MNASMVSLVLRLGRRFARNLLVQGAVIIPRIDVAGNVRRVDREPLDLASVRVKKSLQAAAGIQTQQLRPKTEIDENRMATAILTGK